VRSLGLATDQDVHVDIVVSVPYSMFMQKNLSPLIPSYAASIGCLNESFVRAIYLAAQGKSSFTHISLYPC
jgi:hypothetical protein